MKTAKVQNLKRNTFVKRSSNSNKVYTIACYNREIKKYQLNDETDISRSVNVKKNTVLFYDFEY